MPNSKPGDTYSNYWTLKSWCLCPHLIGRNNSSYQWSETKFCYTSINVGIRMPFLVFCVLFLSSRLALIFSHDIGLHENIFYRLARSWLPSITCDQFIYCTLGSLLLVKYSRSRRTQTILIAIWQHRPLHAKNQCNMNVRDSSHIRVPRLGFKFPLSVTVKALCLSW
jgi:hypothetical protein